MRLYPDRQLRDQERLILYNDSKCNISIDKISKFSIRPPEIRYVIDQVGNYYRWCNIGNIPLKKENMEIHQDICKSMLIDGSNHQIKFKMNAMDEIVDHCNHRLQEESDVMNENTKEMYYMIININRVLNRAQCDNNYEVPTLDDFRLLTFAKKELLYVDDTECKKGNLLVPVYTYIKPKMGHQFILHILLSLGRFETEIDLTQHQSLRDCLRYAKLIGSNTDTDSLQEYSNNLLKKFIEEQVVYFPNSMRQVDSFIVDAAHLFDDVIVNDILPITDLPPIIQSAIFESQNNAIKNFWCDTTATIISSALAELHEVIENCKIPSKEELMSATKQNPLGWNAYESCFIAEHQSENSFQEQKSAILLNQTTINEYINFLDNGNKFIKCLGTHGAPGSGKSFVAQYTSLYAISKGLKISMTSIMARRSCHLGGSHIHKTFLLHSGNNVSPQRQAELAIIRLKRNPVKLNILQTINILFVDEAGQVSAEVLSTIDMFLRRIRQNSIPFGGVLLICTLDHTQLQPVRGKPFLVSTHVLSCFRMSRLQHSVRASNDKDFQRIQTIARMHPAMYKRDSTLLPEFARLYNDVFTFVDDWSSKEIDPNTHRLYGRKVPAQEATELYVQQVRKFLPSNEIRKRISEDTENPLYSHSEWYSASNYTTKKLNKKVKEPETILFFKGAIYECNYNEDGNFSNAQLCMLYDLPNNEDLLNFRKIEVLIAPPGLQDVAYREGKTKANYISEGWTQVKIGTSPEKVYKVSQHVQAQRRQYGLKHRVTSTIHASMGDTLIKVAIEISNMGVYKLWDKAQVIVALSRTRVGKNTIFVGPKDVTVNALVELIQQQNQWTDYMENVLSLTTVDYLTDERESVIFQQQDSHPFRVCNIPLPQENVGYVYFLISCRDNSFTYIGKTGSLVNRLNNHNRGYGSMSTCIPTLRPFVIIGYIYADSQVQKIPFCLQ